MTATDDPAIDVVAVITERVLAGKVCPLCGGDLHQPAPTQPEDWTWTSPRHGHDGTEKR